ncbi:hypothetical protein NEMBOFW57_008568 [Staphylotrichum longicolle]|uniref:Uncharacterized protein n=1 Tax=Staphylotrichum longicolle TaxID=669026 RepID=A0AAD4HXB4_9PEZI|nr:hypothetical protein NEMBOFW57_008568 [Staphylotrichum longicolle]
MAFNLANSAGANTDFLNAFQAPGPDVAARGQFPRLVVARNGSSVPTVNMFIDGELPSLEYAASIVDVCGGETTFALRCTSGPAYIPSKQCGADAVVATLTAGSSTYRVSTATATRTRGSDVTATVMEACDLRGTTEAVCSATVGGTVDNKSTFISSTTTMSGSDYYRYDVAITGGAEKTANPSAQCKPPSSPSGASMKAVGVWGLVGSLLVATFLGF